MSFGRRTVVLKAKPKYVGSEMDALEYFKRYGEHMLAVKLQGYRRGVVKLESFFNDVSALVSKNGDELDTEGL